MAQLAYLSLGSNVGNRKDFLREAISKLQSVGKVTATSSLYETEPVEFEDQPFFLNCAAAVETEFSAQDLMAALLAIEQVLGRRRVMKKGPRTIDIDLLLLGDQVINSKDLTIPHASMTNRRFVLEPLSEIAAGVVHPVLRKNIQELLTELPAGQSVTKIDSSSWASAPAAMRGNELER